MTDKLFLNYEKIEGYCQEIVCKIQADAWQPDYIVGITRGGLLPATLISQYLDVTMCSLDVSLHDSNSDMGPTTNAWMSDDALAGKQILVVDDINDSGATLNWIIDDWKASNRAANPEWKQIFGHNVRFAVIVNNDPSKFKNINYRGMRINKTEYDLWVVFPWEDWWKNKEEPVIYCEEKLIWPKSK